MHRRALVRPPGPNFKDGLTEAALGAPDYHLALAQHEGYCRALAMCGLELITLPPDPNYPDSCFVEDAAVIIDGIAVITRIGHAARRGEEKAVGAALADFKQILNIEEPGTVDGGYVMLLADHLFVGLSRRTNREGAEQLMEIARSAGKSASAIPVSDFLHLKTFVSPIADDTILLLKDTISATYFEMVRNIIEVPREEHWAANCIGINGFAVAPAGCDKTRASLEKAGKTVFSVDVSEFQKMDGRLTCLSVLI